MIIFIPPPYNSYHQSFKKSLCRLLEATKVPTLKWWILHYVNFISVFKNDYFIISQILENKLKMLEQIIPP